MRRNYLAVILAVMAWGTLPLIGQSTGIAANQGAGAASQNTVPAIRILAPAAESKLAQPFVAVRYELTNSGIAPSPNFRVQLDGRDPVVTNTTDYTFTGLAPGKHTILVQLVDANNTPIAGASAQVSFLILPPTTAPTGSVRLHPPDPVLVRAALQEPMVRLTDDPQPLPASGGVLPLLSVIGFGVLLGGIASALKTR